MYLYLYLYIYYIYIYIYLYVHDMIVASRNPMILILKNNPWFNLYWLKTNCYILYWITSYDHNPQIPSLSPNMSPRKSFKVIKFPNTTSKKNHQDKEPQMAPESESDAILSQAGGWAPVTCSKRGFLEILIPDPTWRQLIFWLFLYVLVMKSNLWV